MLEFARLVEEIAPKFFLLENVEMLGGKRGLKFLEHLIALKLHALKHGRIERYLKDYLDVEGLVRANKIDLRQEKVRELFLKYGTLDVYEKISQTTARK